MQETDMRVNALDNLAVELEHKTQHTVGCRVLGPEIDGEITNSSFGHGALIQLQVQRRRIAQVPRRPSRATTRCLVRWAKFDLYPFARRHETILLIAPP